MPILVALLIALVLIVLAFKYWYVTLALIGLVVLAIALPKIVRKARMKRYFASEEFLALRDAQRGFVEEHNAISRYALELEKAGSFSLGASQTGQHAHLATFTNTSQHAYRRDRNVADYASTNVHNCSLQVVRNAAASPIKYLMKYFGVQANDESLQEAERLGEEVSRLETAVQNLKEREASISAAIAPPPFIERWYRKEFTDAVGLQLSPIEVPYSKYAFEYVSAGGNSSQRTDMKLDGRTIDDLIETIAALIARKKSAAGQRALMTAALRDRIKERDSWACRQCGISIADEPHLLLEVDHIMPVSKGGLSVEENLQTLCWRCNRTKAAKIVVSP